MEFGPEDCEVSDDKLEWRPAVGNTGRFGRVKPDVFAARCREEMAKIGTVDPISFEVTASITPVNNQTK